MGKQPPGEKAERGRRRLRKLLKWGLRAGVALLILLLLMLVLLPWITDTAPVRGIVARMVAARLQQVDVRIAVLRVAPLHPHLLRLEGLEVRPRAAPEEPALVLDRLECRWRPAALLRGGLHFTAVEARGLRVDMREVDGRWSLMPAPAEPLRLEELALPLPVRVDRLELSDAELTFAMGEAIRARARGLALRASCELSGRLRGGADARLTAATVELSAPRVQVTLAQGVEARADYWNPDDLARLDAALDVPAILARLEGLGDLDRLSAAAGLAVELDLPGLEAARLELDVLVPGLLGERLALTVARRPAWALTGRNALALDVAGAARLVPSGLALPAEWAAEGWILAETDLRGRLDSLAPPAGRVHARTRLAGAELAAQAMLIDPARRTAAISGLGVEAVHEADARLEGGLAALSLAEARCTLESARAESPGLFGAEATGGRFALNARLSLPALSAMELAVEGSLAELAAAVPEVATVALPVAAGLSVRARDLLRPSAGLGLEAQARLGDALPAASLALDADGWRRIGLRGRVVADLDAVGGLLGGLSEELRGRLGEATAKGSVALAFEADADLPEGDGPSVALGALAAADVTDAALARGGARFAVAAASPVAIASARLEPLPAGVAARLDADARGLELALMGDERDAPLVTLAAQTVGLRLGGALDELGLAGVAAQGECTTAGLALTLAPDAGGPWEFGPFHLAAAGRAEADPLAGDLALRAVQAGLSSPAGELLALRAERIAFEALGADGLNARVEASLPELGRLASAVPAALPEVGGALTARAELSGRLPLAEELAAAFLAGRGLRMPPLFPLDEFYASYAPLSLAAEAALEDLAVRRQTRIGEPIGVAGVAARGELSLAGGDADGRFELSVPTIDVPHSPVPLCEFRAGAQVALRDFDRLTLGPCRLSGPGRMIEASATLAGSGLARLRGRPTPGQALTTLDLSLDSQGTFRAGELPPLAGLALGGAVGWDFRAALSAGEALAVAARPRLEGLSVRFRDIAAVEGVNGSLRFEKAWRIVRADDEAAPLSQELIAAEPQRAGPGLLAGLPEYGGAADRLAAPGEELTVGAVSVLGTELLRDGGLTMEVRGARLAVPALYAHPLGGRLVGRGSFLLGPEGPEASVQGEFTGVDMRRLLRPGLREFGGDPEVSGTVAVSAVLAPPPAGEGQYNVLKDIAGRLELTEVGSDALDRALLALDPEQSNPMILRARSGLLLARPSGASASLQRGFLTGSVRTRGLLGRLLADYSLPRIDLAPLFEVRPLSDAFRRAAPALAALRVLEAERIEVHGDGAVRLR